MSSSVAIPQQSGLTSRGAAAAQNAAADIRRTRFAFAAVCCYLASQAVYLPVVAVGPSWAIWPTPSDLAATMVIAALLLGIRNQPVRSGANRRVLSVLVFIAAANVVGFVAMNLGRLTSGSDAGKSASFAIYQVYRTLQFLLVFRLAAGIPLTRRRIELMLRITEAVLVILFLGVAAMSVSILSSRLLISHVPVAAGVAGAWGALLREDPSNIVGTVGWDHAYVGLQLIMATALRLSLRGSRQSISDAVYILLAMAGVFLSGSRSAMAGVLLLVGLLAVRRPGMVVTMGVLTVMALIAAGGLIQNSEDSLAALLERQLSLTRPLESGNLSGRQYIWEDRVDSLRSNPVSWIIGSGLGTGSETSQTAHCLYLHIFTETGMIGLIVFGVVFAKLINTLRKSERDAKPVYLATFGFLLTAMTQETFYPVAYLGHFMGFYFCSVAIALRPHTYSLRAMRQPTAEAHKT